MNRDKHGETSGIPIVSRNDKSLISLEAVSLSGPASLNELGNTERSWACSIVRPALPEKLS
jgi:hypothetical protein